MIEDLANKLSEIFADNTIKTIGDLVDARQLTDLEQLPQTVRDHPISIHEQSVLPSLAYDEMNGAGIKPDAINALVEEVIDFKIEMIEQAIQVNQPS